MIYTLLIFLLCTVPFFILRFSDKSINSDPVWGSFLGVISALIVFLLQRSLEQHFERKRKNRLGIAKVQIECVKLIHAMAWNIKELKQLQKTMLPPKEGVPRELYFYLIQPREMIIDPSIIEGVKRLEFVQGFFDMYLKIQDVNSIMNSTRQANDRFENIWRGKSVPDVEVKLYRDRLTEQIEVFEKVHNTVKDVLAKSRVLSKKGFLSSIFNRNGYSKKLKEKFQNELKIIEEDMPQYEVEKIPNA